MVEAGPLGSWKHNASLVVGHYTLSCCPFYPTGVAADVATGFFPTIMVPLYGPTPLWVPPLYYFCCAPPLQPLNPDPSSTWHQYFEDNELLVQIDHDTRRLYPDMSFFQLPTPYPQTQYNTGTIMKLDALKKRVDRSTLPSQLIATSRGGIKNVSVASCQGEDMLL